jgi:Co/Zn/Cd efflux system component
VLLIDDSGHRENPRGADPTDGERDGDSHAGHSHSHVTVSEDTDSRRLTIALALLVAALMLRAAFGLLRDSGRVLLEAAPEGMSVKEIGGALAAHPHVESLHDLHVWEVGSGFPALSAHVLVHPGDDCHEIRRELEALVKERFKIEHTALQVDHSSEGALLSIGRSSHRSEP